VLKITFRLKYDKQDQQGKAAFNERNPHPTQQQEPVTSSPGAGSREHEGHRTFPLSLMNRVCNFYIILLFSLLLWDLFFTISSNNIKQYLIFINIYQV
jgi:hypothetical protein